MAGLRGLEVSPHPRGVQRHRHQRGGVLAWPRPGHVHRGHGVAAEVRWYTTILNGLNPLPRRSRHVTYNSKFTCGERRGSGFSPFRIVVITGYLFVHTDEMLNVQGISLIN